MLTSDTTKVTLILIKRCKATLCIKAQTTYHRPRIWFDYKQIARADHTRCRHLSIGASFHPWPVVCSDIYEIAHNEPDHRFGSTHGQSQLWENWNRSWKLKHTVCVCVYICHPYVRVYVHCIVKSFTQVRVYAYCVHTYAHSPKGRESERASERENKQSPFFLYSNAGYGNLEAQISRRPWPPCQKATPSNTSLSLYML